MPPGSQLPTIPIVFHGEHERQPGFALALPRDEGIGRNQGVPPEKRILPDLVVEERFAFRVNRAQPELFGSVTWLCLAA